MLGLIVVAIAVLYFLFALAGWFIHFTANVFGFGMLVGGAVLLLFFLLYLIREFREH